MTGRHFLLAACVCVLATGCAAGDSTGDADAAVPPTGVTPRATTTTTDPPTITTAVPSEPRPVPADTLVEPETPRPSTVAVVGDSLTVSAREEIELALGGSGLRVVALDGLESRRMSHGGSTLPPGVTAVDAILEVSKPDLWVIALGTNDVASVGNLDGFRTDMDAILQRIPDDASIIWVDLWIRDRSASIIEANQLIRAELRLWSGGAAVVDWHAHGDRDGIITGDGVHLTAAGQQLFADSIVSAIDDLYGADDDRRPSFDGVEPAALTKR